MAEFTPDVSGPQSAWMIGRGAEAPKSIVGGLADTLTNAVSTGIDIFRKDKQSNLEQQVGGEYDQAVRDYANGQSASGGPTAAPAGAPQLVGQKTNPAESDPGYQAAAQEIDKHASAAAQGSPGAKQAFLTRVSEITSRYAAQNPYYAPALRDYAQKVLGFNANEQLYSVASEAEGFQKKLSQSAQTIVVNKAADAGATHFNSDGTVDLRQTMLNGQAMLAQEHETAAALSQAQLAQAQAKPQMPLDQQNDLEFRTAQPAVTKIITASTNGLFSNLKGVLDKWDASKPMDQAMIATTIGRTEAQAEFAVNKFADQNNLSFQTRQNLIANTKAEFAPFSTIMGTDLTSAKQIAQALQKIKDQYFIDLSKTAPGVAAAITIGGPQAASAMVQNFTAPSATNPQFERFGTDLNNYFQQETSPADVIRGVNGVMAGKYSIAAEPDPQKAKAVATNAIPVLDHFSDNPAVNLKDPKAQKAFGNLVQGTSEAAVGSNDPATILNVAPHLLRPGTVQGLIAYTKNPANANDAEKTMSFYGQYVARARLESAKVIQAGADTTIVNTIRPGYQVGYHVHYSGQPGSDGNVTPTFDAKDAQGHTVQLTDAQKRQVLSADKGFTGAISTFNQSNKADQMVVQSFKEQQNPRPKAQQAAAAPTQTQLAVNKVFAGKVTELFPGAKIESTVRSAEANAKAGGAKNSMHLHGEAIDFSAPGMTKDQVRQKLEAEGLPVTELLDSTDEAHLGVGHMKPGEFHWGWGEKKLASR